MEHDISPQVRKFIGQYIVSIEQLEVLQLLRDERAGGWTVDEINARLRSQESSIRKWLEAFVALGFAVQQDGRFRFAPRSEELAKGAAELAEAYRERHIKVIEIIFSKPNESLLGFVRAFDLRRRS